MRTLNTLCLIFILNTLFAQTSIKDKPFLQNYEGTINGKIPIQMQIVNWGTGDLVGNYFYKKVGKKLNLSGAFTGTTAFKLQEYANEKHTGTFVGTFADLQKISGTWSNVEGTKKFPFQVTAIKTSKDNSGWAGAWYLNDVWDGGTLLINNVRKDSFDFALNVFRSGHLGEIEGTAFRSGNTAKFSQAIVESDENEKCGINFRFNGGQIEVEQLSSGFACGFGMRAYATGTFASKKIEKRAKFNYGAEEVFANKAQHDGFFALVGSKMYELFAYNMQGFEKPEQEPSDGFKATVVVGAATGMYLSNEAIILYDGRGKYWAATLDFEGEKGLVRYFSNDDKLKKKLPATIEKWRERFPDYAVRYEK